MRSAQALLGQCLAKGWFRIEGLQDGPRTLEDQIKGIEPALAECKGKTILDLGCAEFLIGLEFAKAGAKEVVGVECNQQVAAVARRLSLRYPTTRVEHADLNRLAKNDNPEQYDIVLSLGVCHKLMFPDMGVRFSALSSRDLVVFGFSARQEFESGEMRSKGYPQNSCNVYEIMEECGFTLEKILPRSRQETAQYYRRNK
jgi:predicted TPR repeat methyltransferase